MTRSWAILGQFYAMSGLRKEREGGTWKKKADVRSISRNVHAARARARFSSFRMTMLKPSWCHFRAILEASWGHKSQNDAQNE